MRETELNRIDSLSNEDGNKNNIVNKTNTSVEIKRKARKKKTKNFDLMIAKREQKKKRNLERIQNLRLMDDLLMTRVFDDRDKDVTSYILRIILGRQDLEVTEVHSQYTISNLKGRSIKLDVHAKDGNEEFNVEVQRTNAGASPERTRYHLSMMDANTIVEQEDFKDLPTTYIIFITENDIFGGNKPVYHVKKVIEETGEIFNDRAYVIFVNGSYRRDPSETGELSDIEKLIIDFNRSDTDNFYHKILGDRVAYIKNSGEDVKFMLDYIIDHADEFREEFREEGDIIRIFTMILNSKKQSKSLTTLQEILEFDDDDFNDFLFIIEDNPEASPEELCQIYLNGEE